MTEPEKRHDVGLNAAVAAVLRGEKHAQQLTNQDLSERSGIPVVSVQRYLNMKRGIDMPVLYSLATAVGMLPERVVELATERLRVDAKDAAQLRKLLGDVIDEDEEDESPGRDVRGSA